MLKVLDLCNLGLLETSTAFEQETSKKKQEMYTISEFHHLKLGCKQEMLAVVPHISIA